MSGTGSITIDFGAFPGSNEAEIAVYGQRGFDHNSLAEAWMSTTPTADHTASDHKYAACFIHLTCSNMSGTGFSIYARATEKMQGTWNINWVWA